MAENAALKEELTARRAEQQQTYVPKPLDLSEYKTRKLYIDTMLEDAGWTEGKDWLNEVELPGMPNKSEVGYADYVLYGDDGRPLAVIEAKRTCVDAVKGRQQAKLYADLLEKKYHLQSSNHADESQKYHGEPQYCRALLSGGGN